VAKIPGLTKRGSIYWYERMTAGKRLRVSLCTENLEEAIAALKKYRTSPHVRSSATIEATVESFIADRLREDRITDSTSRAIRVSLGLLTRSVGNVPLSAITEGAVQKWFNAQREKSTEATGQTHLNRVRSFFRWCVQKKLLTVTPCDGVTIGRVSRKARLRFCTGAERDKLIADTTAKDGTTNRDLRMALSLGFYCGLRRGEISEVRPDWFDLDAGVLHVRKTDTFRPKDREERAVPIAKPFVEWLRSLDHTGWPYVIAPWKLRRGRSIYRYDIRAPFEAHVAKSGYAWVTPHVMRHTFASLLVSAGVSIYKVAVWLGDEVRTVERHYAKIIPRDSDIDKM
jgi:integrase